MRSNATAPRRRDASRRAAVSLAAALAIARYAVPARADSPVPKVLPVVGKTIEYRITRTAQGNTGPRSALSVVTLHRKSATTLTLKGLYDRPSALNVLAVDADGSVQIAEADRTGKDEGSLSDIVSGLNHLSGIFAGKSSVPAGGWSARLRLPDVRGASAPVVIPIAVENAKSGNFELHGVGQLAIDAEPPALPGGPLRGFGGRPFRIPGGVAAPLPADQSAPTNASSGRQEISVAVSVDGRISHGAVGKISIVETRSTIVDALPYVNVSGWTIETLK
jgi:hypothetical protein